MLLTELGQLRSGGGEIRALSTAMDQLDQLAADHFGLNRTDQRSLDVISQAGAITPAQLAAAVGITPSAVTTVLDRLENAGYVRRDPAPHDRRRTIVVATPRTHTRSAQLFTGITAAAAAHAEQYADNELIAIADFLAHHRATIDTVLRDHRARGQQARPRRRTGPATGREAGSPDATT